MTRRTFTVDAKLLRELGARLVGRPHIALAELIKNSYDADARHVEISFTRDRIRVVDDGHGMDEDAFLGRWMRIGTTAKLKDRISPALERSLTGSKGVGRLSAQLLADSLELRSVALVRPSSLVSARRPVLEPQVHARIHWPTELTKADLTQVAVDVWTGEPAGEFAAGSRHGTTVELTALTADWDAEAFRALAREIWALQPPFDVPPDESKAFTVTLDTPFADIQESFESQMTALMDIAAATVTGQLLAPGKVCPRNAERFALPTRTGAADEDGEVTRGGSADDAGPDAGDVPKAGPVRTPAKARQLLVTVRVLGAEPQRYVIEIPDCQIADLDFQIRVFDLHYRQPKGIKVDVARRYLAEFGGVHLYDSRFRLPYYGPEMDWLRLELDHARRISRSQLVPEHLQVRNAMQDLPSNKRVFGAVNISTSAEQRAALEAARRPTDALAIQITRDRLVDNLAFAQLTRAVRLSVHLYALVRAKTKARRQLRPRGGVRPDSSAAIRNASEVVDALRPTLPEQDYQSLKDTLDAVAEDLSTQRREARAYASLLGALATAGMTSLAYEHEVSKQRDGIASVARNLQRLTARAPAELQPSLNTETQRLLGWKERLNRIRALFRPLLEEESRTAVARYKAAKVVHEAVETIMVLARATEVDESGVPADLVLPMGSYAAWTAILQNLLTNALRATLEARPSLVAIDGGRSNGRAWLRVQDNGQGMDLSDAERLFMPFERGPEEPSRTERAASLGLGGSGLGLTIVRMITDELGCSVAFVEPADDWSTAVRVEWRE